MATRIIQKLGDYIYLDGMFVNAGALLYFFLVKNHVKPPSYYSEWNGLFVSMETMFTFFYPLFIGRTWLRQKMPTAADLFT